MNGKMVCLEQWRGGEEGGDVVCVAWHNALCHWTSRKNTWQASGHSNTNTQVLQYQGYNLKSYGIPFRNVQSGLLLR